MGARTDRRTETVVVGGGLGGMATAVLLARAGRRVRVLEKAEHLGGRARSQTAAGFTLNLGPHALYLGGPAERVLGELGLSLAGGMPETSGGIALDGGRCFTLPTGPLSLLATGLVPVGSKIELARFLARLPRLDTASLMPRTVREHFDDTFEHPASRAMLGALARLTTYTNAPDLLSAGVTLAQLASVQKNNVRYLDGGWQTMVDALAAAATEAGVAIEAGAKAVSIAAQDGRASGVELEGGRVVPADSVVIAASPRVASALLRDDADLAERAARAVPVEAACLDVALERLPRPRSRFLLGIDEPVYASVHSAFASLAPKGGAVVHVARYLAPGESSPSEADLEAVLEALQPGASALIAHRRFLPRMTVAHDVARAAPAGLAARCAGTSSVLGVALVGDWVGPEGLLADAVFASASAAVRLILNGEERAAA